MGARLEIALGQYSACGAKPVNQDFHAAIVPAEPLLSRKGAVVAIADGISSSMVSQEASAMAVRSFLDDYYCTSDAWSVSRSAQTVLLATNSWLYAQSQRSQYRFERDKGYVCTFSALVIKSTRAHLLHVGDTRVYRLHGTALEQLTTDHRVSVGGGESYLGRALGMAPQLEIDYQSWGLEVGECLLLSSDGVHEHMDGVFVGRMLREHADDLNLAAQRIVEEAGRRGSRDNQTLQIVRIEQLPEQGIGEIQQQRIELPLPPMLEAGMLFDGYKILRDLHRSSRSHLYLASDQESGEQVVIKTPSVDMSADSDYLDRFVLEDWVARRLHHPHVVRSTCLTRKRAYLYVALEFIEGQTLAQWMRDHPNPSLEQVRSIVEQTAKALQAFHHLEMLYQDLRPENLMIDQHGSIKLIDLASTQVAGLADSLSAEGWPGTMQYAAPECLLGEPASLRSEVFSLGVIAYQMVSGHLPYGTQLVRVRSRAALQNLRYRSLDNEGVLVPGWLDAVLRKAVHPLPDKRYEALSEFIHALRHPRRETRNHIPWLERDPLLFWRCTSLFLFLLVLGLLSFIHLRMA
ncbi:bifunctional protein-serine/threonine kinase/phosphatase [Methylobacillus arboreus]|uniref:bifunctional protein-serine/threonine kinase/phosphatase n=1 Tax=Methylobacillus arboreus TaxID=755170 RepID=UPI001E429A3E|nr:bifunctional protein-serine/threonine kinase/phosphatase [Methylobacillus arboreus]MCB5191534.1 bifunctional protein-serine/threonine kinase/phosphatase [Methylobacillus arboreus]